MAYLFAGSNRYPSVPPGDFVHRGTHAACVEALNELEGYVVRRYSDMDGPVVRGVAHKDGDMPDDDLEHYTERIQWWVILDDDMLVVERGSID